MTIPTITARPTRDEPGEFWEEAELAWDQLPLSIDGINASLSGIDSAVATVTAGLAAGPWVSGTTYAIGDLRFSPNNGFLYRRKTAGAGTTDPSADGTNWALQTIMGLPLVIVSGTTHTAAVNTYCVLVNASATEITAPASMAVGDQFGIRAANGRWDNVLKLNSQRAENQADDLYLDHFDAFGLWRMLVAGGGNFGMGRV